MVCVFVCLWWNGRGEGDVVEYSHLLLFAKLGLCNAIACPNAIHWKQEAMCSYINLGSFREPTSYAELCHSSKAE